LVDELEYRGKRLRDLGEKRVIEEIISKYISKPALDEHLGFPNDARDIIPIAPRLLFSIDGYSIESVKLPWRSFGDVGWCSVVATISDHVVKGGFPRDIVISLGLDRDMLVDDLIDLLEGVKDALEEYNLRLLGGDLNYSPNPWINVSLLSYTAVKKPPSRCCGVVGDKIIVTGFYGAMGVVTLHGLDEAGSYKWVVDYTKRPRVYIALSTVIGLYYRAIHSSMDVSDGLGYTLLELSKQSGLGVSLHDLPNYYDELNELCGGDADCLWRYVLNGGEEYGAVLFVDHHQVDAIMDYLKKLEIPAKVVGEVVDKPPHIYIKEAVFDKEILYWDHFRGFWSEQYF